MSVLDKLKSMLSDLNIRIENMKKDPGLDDIATPALEQEMTLTHLESTPDNGDSIIARAKGLDDVAISTFFDVIKAAWASNTKISKIEIPCSFYPVDLTHQSRYGSEPKYKDCHENISLKPIVIHSPPQISSFISQLNEIMSQQVYGCELALSTKWFLTFPSGFKTSSFVCILDGAPGWDCPPSIAELDNFKIIKTYNSFHLYNVVDPFITREELESYAGRSYIDNEWLNYTLNGNSGIRVTNMIKGSLTVA